MGSGELKVNRVTGKAGRKFRILLPHSEQTRLACEYHRLQVVSFCPSESVEEMQKSSGEVTSESARHCYFLLYLRPQSFRLTDSRRLIGHFAARFLCFLNWFRETERVCSAILSIKAILTLYANNNMPQLQIGANPFGINTAFQSTRANFTKFVNFCFVCTCGGLPTFFDNLFTAYFQ